MSQKHHYNKLDGLRAIAAVGVVLMHVQANLPNQNSGFLFEQMIPSFTNLVFLFMVISGFSVCCGYFEKFVSNEISLELFYRKRFAKVWPFFALLCLFDLVFSPSIESIYEIFANLTLCFGLIPNHGIEVIGVGWFLGLVFVFYMLFPFFCFLLSKKDRAWFAFVVALVLNYLCANYFDVNRTSIAYSAVFFLLGGIIYLYRLQLQYVAERFGWLVLLTIFGVAMLYFAFGAHVLIMLALYGLLVIFALRGETQGFDLLDNPVTQLLSGISLEIYLSHMMVLRVLEIILWDKLRGINVDLQYAIMAFLTLGGTVGFSCVAKKMLAHIENHLKIHSRRCF